MDPIPRLARLAGPAVAALTALSCTGHLSTPGTDGGEVGSGPNSAPVEPKPTAALPPSAYAPARLRRLTTTEITNVVSDLFFSGQSPTDKYPDEPAGHRFDNEYDTLGVSVELTSALQDAAERAGAALAPQLSSQWPCAATTADSSCAAQIIEQLGLRVWRRPLAETERTRLLALFTATRAENDFAASIATLVEALLQSPHFLFRFELGMPAAAGTSVVSLSPYEAASALSFALWRSSPDDALLEATRTGTLDSQAGLTEQTSRLLLDARAKRGLTDFFLQWQDLIRPELMSKADPSFTPALADSMQDEARAFIVNTLWGAAPSFQTLLTSRETAVDLAPDERSGFLTQPAFVASHTPGAGFNPVLPGHFVRTRLLCQELPPPPPGVPNLVPDGVRSTRELFGEHSSNSACTSCHELMDPIGWGFERYDALGRYHTTEGETALTGRGELKGTDVDGGFVGPGELAQKLSASLQAQRCLVAQTLRYVLGRDTVAAAFRKEVDARAVDAVMAGGFQATSDLKQMLSALVTTDAFRFRDASALPTPGAP